jgi:uncharacterized coiled-coil protein SlyX
MEKPLEALDHVKLEALLSFSHLSATIGHIVRALYEHEAKFAKFEITVDRCVSAIERVEGLEGKMVKQEKMLERFQADIRGELNEFKKHINESVETHLEAMETRIDGFAETINKDFSQTKSSLENRFAETQQTLKEMDETYKNALKTMNFHQEQLKFIKVNEKPAKNLR